MSTHRQIRDAIAAVLTGLTTAAKVHTFERYTQDLNGLKTLYVEDNKLIGVHIRRIATRRQAPYVGRTNVKHRWQLRFYMALDDAAESELLFDDWIEQAADALNAQQTLGGLVADCSNEDGEYTVGLQVDDSGPVMFCGVLSHSAKCTLYTWHQQ